MNPAEAAERLALYRCRLSVPGVGRSLGSEYTQSLHVYSGNSEHEAFQIIRELEVAGVSPGISVNIQVKK